MRTLTGIGLVLAATFVATASAGDKKEKPFEIAGVCSIDPPGPGLEWKVIKTLMTGNIKGHVCRATDDGKTAVVVMIVEQRTATKFSDRSALMMTNWEAILALKEKGYTDMKEKAPALPAAIPNENFYGLDAKNKDGVPTFVRGATVFRKFTYNFTVFSKDMATADKMLKVIKSIKEAN